MKEFFKAAGIRAVRTMAQTALAAFGSSAAILSDVNWLHVVSAAILGGIMSFLMSIATGLPEIDKPKEGDDDVA